jgi:DNA-binding HxlR family transcriptional regulator
MKAILEFNLPEDNVEYNLANKGQDFHTTLWDMDQWLRSNTKYAPDTMSEDTFDAYQKCREKLHEFMNENNVKFLD